LPPARTEKRASFEHRTRKEKKKKRHLKDPSRRKKGLLYHLYQQGERPSKEGEEFLKKRAFIPSLRLKRRRERKGIEEEGTGRLTSRQRRQGHDAPYNYRGER